MPVKTPKSPKTGDYSSEFNERTLSFRGTTYRLVELDVDKYDDLVEMATSKVANAQGEEVEMLDQAALNKLVALHSLAEPKMSSLQKKPIRLVNRLVQEARDLNFGYEPEDGEKKKEDEPDIQEGEPEEEGEV